MAEEKTLQPLNDQQELFCNEYIKDFNGSQACIRAGYSEKTSRSIASTLLTKVNILARIDELKKDIFAAVGISQFKIYNELRRVALLDLSGAFDENGALKSIHDIPEDVRAAIVGVEVDELFDWIDGNKVIIGQTKKLKVADKLNSIAQIVKIGGWAAPDKFNLSGELSVKQITGMEIK